MIVRLQMAEESFGMEWKYKQQKAENIASESILFLNELILQRPSADPQISNRFLIFDQLSNHLAQRVPLRLPSMRNGHTEGDLVKLWIKIHVPFYSTASDKESYEKADYLWLLSM